MPPISLKSMQYSTVLDINTVKTLTTGNIFNILITMLNNPSLSFEYSKSPIEYLSKVLKDLGATYEDVQRILTTILTWILPTLEISVKAILLTNLKKMVSCSIDPRIPEKYRKLHKDPNNRNTVNEYGIDIDVESIDILDKLSINPLSNEGRNTYFGLRGVEDVYKFARAEDFDAFLWFVIHKGKLPNCALLSSMDDFNDDVHGAGRYEVEEDNPTLLKVLNLRPKEDNDSTILLGNTFAYENGANNNPNVVSMCVEAWRDEKNRIVHNTLVPISDDLTSVNWYIRRAEQLGRNFGVGWEWVYDKESKTVSRTALHSRFPRYSDERAICNLQYMGIVGESQITGLVNNKIRFTILPKPLIHIPDIANGEPPWRFKKLLFDAEGNYDPNGKYTIIGEDSKSFEYLGGNIVIEPKSGNVSVIDKDVVLRNLVECYPGLTVYEFNYDYVMGMRLFDAKSIVMELMDAVLNTRLGFSLSLTPKHQEATEKIKEIIKSIIESEDSEINDCYFTFDNKKYDALLQRAQERKAKGYKFGGTSTEIGVFDSVMDILAEYDAETEEHKQIEVLHRAITQAAVTLTDGLNEVDSYDTRYGFIFDLVSNLVLSIVMSLLSPKVLMLLEINQQLMGGAWEKITFDELLLSMQTIIADIVKEVSDLVEKELLKFVIQQLQSLKEKLLEIITRERLEDITNAIQRLMRHNSLDGLYLPYQTIRSIFGDILVDTNLDMVDYADIDMSTSNNGEKPRNNNC